MKNLLLVLSVVLLLSSCEDVIDVDLDTSSPRLVIEASINVLEDGSTASIIRLSKTAPFFDNIIPPVEDAIVTITSENGEEYSCNHIENGEYSTPFIPDPELEYTLTVIEDGQTYTATEQLNTVSPIGEITQDNEGGFTGEEIELRFTFEDPEGIENYYYLESLCSEGNEQDIFDDEFFDGNDVPVIFFLDDGLEAGDIVTFNLFGIDEPFYNFMTVLLQQGSDDGGGPFETQPATVKGNIVNTTNPENYPLGYFRISQLSTVDYTIQ